MFSLIASRCHFHLERSPASLSICLPTCEQDAKYSSTSKSLRAYHIFQPSRLVPAAKAFCPISPYLQLCTKYFILSATARSLITVFHLHTMLRLYLIDDVHKLFCTKSEMFIYDHVHPLFFLINRD